MYHFFNAKKKLVTAVIESSSLSFSLFEYDTHVISQKVFKKVPLMHSEIVEGKIFNITLLRTFFKSFLLDNKAQDVFVAITLEGAVLQEKVLLLNENNDDTPSRIAQEVAPSNIWNFHFLGNKQHIYFFSIARELCIQYQLLALLTPFNCCLLSSNTRALIELVASNKQKPVTTTLNEYRHMGIITLKEQNIITNYIKNVSADEEKTIAIHAGLFLLGKCIINEDTK